MVTNDRRTDAQKQTLNVAVVAYDKFMSGWGEARNGDSWCAWVLHDPYNTKLLDRLLLWVNSREEMRNVNVVDLSEWEPPRSCAHFSIYVTYPQHPAFDRGVADV